MITTLCNAIVYNGSMASYFDSQLKDARKRLSDLNEDLTMLTATYEQNLWIPKAGGYALLAAVTADVRLEQRAQMQGKTKNLQRAIYVLKERAELLTAVKQPRVKSLAVGNAAFNTDADPDCISTSADKTCAVTLKLTTDDAVKCDKAAITNTNLGKAGEEVDKLTKLKTTATAAFTNNPIPVAVHVAGNSGNNDGAVIGKGARINNAEEFSGATNGFRVPMPPVIPPITAPTKTPITQNDNVGGKCVDKTANPHLIITAKSIGHAVCEARKVELIQEWRHTQLSTEELINDTIAQTYAQLIVHLDMKAGVDENSLKAAVRTPLGK
uniref:Variant surface glycoprotein 1125.2801 n=1 Tax=Trypanosoma brucei TaxID=5691 RepID=A0A1J0R8N2_9TRYP|nr:variant surface glycoprotein 1125.2801 [Trypanosoma brucei]